MFRRHLDAGDDAAAAAEFFDFRCADIAMGSGHFLVAAVDRIEARLSAFLALNPIPVVTAELEQLRTAALHASRGLAAKKSADVNGFTFARSETWSPDFAQIVGDCRDDLHL